MRSNRKKTLVFALILLCAILLSFISCASKKTDTGNADINTANTDNENTNNADTDIDGLFRRLKWGNVWCVSAGELYKWIKENDEGVEDWTLRLHQVMGMPTSKECTTVTALWVDADLLYRPANVTDPNAEMTSTYQSTGNEQFDKTYKQWFDGNIIWSYFDSAFPWTRLGYTYDWADNGREYGVSEFLIFSGEKATVAYTYDVEDFVAYAEEFDK